MFFFYGTLILDSGNPVSERVRTGLVHLGPAVAQGRLVAIPTRQGWYPALLTEDGAGPVRGEAYAAGPSWSRQDLALLDAYEAFDPERPEASEYRRCRLTVSLAGREKHAEAYVYSAALPAGTRAVEHGDFRRFLADTGLPPYRPEPDELRSLLARSPSD